MELFSIDEGMFLNSLEEFKTHLLPTINNERVASGLPALTTEQEIIDEYLDRYREHHPEE